MKSLFSLLTITLLTALPTQGPLGHPARVKDAPHTMYVIGLSQQTTITIRNHSPNPISVLLAALNVSGFRLDDGVQRVNVPAAGSKDLRAAELPPGTVTLRMESVTTFTAYAYAETARGARAEFVPALNAGERVLRFPQLDKGDASARTITLFNPTEQAAAVELIALDDSGSELGRAHGGVLLPRQTLELAAGALLSGLRPEDISVIVVSSPSALMGQQRVTLPRGDTFTLPAYVDGEGRERLPSFPTPDGGRNTKPQTASSEMAATANASASLDDYPFKDSPYCPVNVLAPDCAPETRDPYGFFFRECTSFVAWRMNRDAGTPDRRNPSFTNTMKGGRWSDGGKWSANARKLGYRVDKKAEPGAIAQWEPNQCSGCTVGHVAYVESVNADGSVNLSEYNYGRDFKFKYNYRPNVPASKVSWFIHVPKPASSAARPVVSASLRVLTASPLTVDQRVQVTFSVTNRGGKAVTFQRLLAGGRRGGDPNCNVGGCPDFPSMTNVTLNPGQSVTYTQSQTFTTADRYNFFVAYLTGGGWVTSVERDAGVGNAVEVKINPKPPTVTGYSWDTTPKSNKAFSGTVRGTSLISGGTQVWFCVNKKDKCHPHPSTSVDVKSSGRVIVSNVKLASGSWQIYVSTSAGKSERSTAFTVK